MAYHLRYYDKDGEQIAQTVDLKDRGAATDLFDKVCAEFDHDIGPDGAVTVELDDNGTVSWKHKRTAREPEVVIVPFVEPEPDPEPEFELVKPLNENETPGFTFGKSEQKSTIAKKRP